MKTQSFCLKKAQVDLDFCHLSYGNKTEVLLCVYAGLFHYLMADISVPYLCDPQYKGDGEAVVIPTVED